MVDVIVTGERGAAAAVEEAVVRQGGAVAGRLAILNGVTGTVPAENVAALSAAPGVVQVTVDRAVHVQGDINGIARPRSVYRQATGALNLQDAGVSGEGVTVALIDTGVADVPDVAGRVRTVADRLTGRTSRCVDFSGEDHCGDSYGHGTFMAGLIMGDGTASGGQFTGMAPRADLISLKVAGRDGSSDVSKVIAAIQWAVENRQQYGIDVINLSMGTDSAQSWTTDPFNYAVERAWDAGIFVAVSASNRGPAPGTISKPGDDPWVLTVGALDDRETQGSRDDRPPDFSGRGPTADGVAKPDVVAPGAHLVSLRAPGSAVDAQFPTDVGGSYRRGSGTSMATAVVSGGVALLLEQHPDWSPGQVKAALTETAQPTASSDTGAVGRGAVDLPRAAALGVPEVQLPEAHSSGLGLLDASRGSVSVHVDDIWGTVLTGGLTAQMLLWDPLGFATGAWQLDPWSLSQYAAYRWYETSWSGDDWMGAAAAGNNWQGTGSWLGNNWQGNNWQGNNWQGNNWQGDWDGSTADGETSTAPQTYGRPWTGAAWLGLWE